MERSRILRGQRFLTGERAADLLLWVAISGLMLFADELPQQRWWTGLPLLWVKVGVVPLLGLAVAVSRRHPVVAAAVPAGLGLAVTPDLYVENLWIAQVLLAFLLGRRTPSMRPGLLLFGGVCLVGLILAVANPSVPLSIWFSTVLNAVVTIMVPWLAGRYVRQHDELISTGWQLAKRLEREQDLIGERIRLLERSRIAGDMHDSLGHELSLIALRAGALQVDPKLAESARKAAHELRESADAATGRLQEIIGVLREETEAAPVLPTSDTVAALVERAAASGLAVTLDGQLGSLPPMADRAVYRVVQEALTNAAKHAPGAPVTVRLGVDAAAGEAEVTVANAAAPAGPPPGPGSGGYGLVSLDERVRLAGGRLHASPADGGFAVTARLPLTAGAAVTPPATTRELALARRKVRRSLIDAIWVPAVAAATLLLLSFGFNLYTSYRSVLDSAAYGGLRLGQSQTSVQTRLPAYQVDDERPRGAPADPAGTDECRFYRTTASSISPAYRLCFSDGRLSHKDRVTITKP
jgi:signal transduction histidine kinase